MSISSSLQGNVSSLSNDQQALFWQQGYLIVENIIDADTLVKMQIEFNDWVYQSRKYTQPYGTSIDGRPRFDIEIGHSANSPALRRVNAPTDISKTYFDVMSSSRMTNCVADLIGPNVKFHHAKINSKQPDSATAVKWHQDFPFTPHSNDDLVTALLMIDDVTEENGPLEVVPGSHRGELYSLWHDGIFTGAVADDIAERCRRQAVMCTGVSGSVCLMHTRLLHGSAPNVSTAARTLFICVYSAEDAQPCALNPVPSQYEGLVVRGVKTNKIRSSAYSLELPQKPQGASFFDQQTKHTELGKNGA